MSLATWTATGVDGGELRQVGNEATAALVAQCCMLESPLGEK